MDVSSMLAAGPASLAQLVGVDSSNATQTPDLEFLPVSVTKLAADHSHPNQQEQQHAISGDQEASLENTALSSSLGPLLTAESIPHGPPPASLAQAGEAALRQIGLTDPLCPSMNLTPWFCFPSDIVLIPNSLEYYGRQADIHRLEVRRWVRKVGEWAGQRDWHRCELKRGREGIWPTWTFPDLKSDRKRTKLQHRRAQKKVEMYTRRMLSAMTKVYTFAVRAAESESFWKADHEEYSMKEEWKKYLSEVVFDA